MDGENELKRPRPDDTIVDDDSVKKPRVEEVKEQKTVPAKEEQSVPPKEELSVPQQTIKMATNNVEPPAFLSATHGYEEYKADLKMWSRLTPLDAKLQAEMVVYKLTGHPSRIKEKIMTQMGAKLEGNANGITELITFLDGIYDVDDMSTVWASYNDFTDVKRQPGQDVQEFVAEWRNKHQKAKTAGCNYSDVILGLKLLKDVELTEIDTNIVLTAVDFKKAKEDEKLQEQIEAGLKKFKGNKGVSADVSNMANKEHDVLISKIETVLIAKGWKPPGGGNNKNRKRSRSVSPAKPGGYKGKKNPLDKNFKVMKCFKCKCEHTEKCNCPCVYHLANNCSKRGEEKKEEKKEETGYVSVHRD